MGFPLATGAREGGGPVNSVLPAWDIAMGHLAALAVLAADRHRLRTGEGSHVRLALSDVALAMTAALGRLAQGELGQEAPPDGNFLYGAFGRDFATRDGRRVMVVALTRRQWRALKAATDLDVAALERETGADLETEGGRYLARDAIACSLEGWFAARDFVDIRARLSAAGVSWGPYQSFAQLAVEDPRASLDNPMLRSIQHPGLGLLRTPASPLDFSSATRRPPEPAPRLGEHTNVILSELGFSKHEIASLHDRSVVAGGAG
jgi:2-methylfumaryl-CoA isomerase